MQSKDVAEALARPADADLADNTNIGSRPRGDSFAFSAFQCPKIATWCRRNRRDWHISPDHGHAATGHHAN
jgi:hypothetical protein